MLNLSYACALLTQNTENRLTTCNFPFLQIESFFVVLLTALKKLIL